MNHRKLTILMAEDDDGHATLIRRNLDRTPPRSRGGAPAQWPGDSRSSGAQPAERAHLPMLLLLDISMPKVDGIEVLRRIKADPATRAIPVYMLTTTDNPVEIDRCFELGCNAYVTKPIAYDAFIAGDPASLRLFSKSRSFPEQSPPTQMSPPERRSHPDRRRQRRDGDTCKSALSSGPDIEPASPRRPKRRCRHSQRARAI